MKIFSIELTNFRQYKGYKKIDFSIDDKKSFTIIQGANGAGKTNLLNAITWCLYGKEEHLSRISQEKMIDPVNKKVLEETKDDQLIEMKVCMKLGNEKPEYIIERTKRGYKLSDNDVNYDKEDFQVLWLDNRDWKRVASQPNYFINLLLPEGIHDFFFFDGEKLDDFFKEGTKRVKDSILRVSTIELLDKAIEHMEYVRDDIRRSSKGLSSNADTISEQIDALKSQLEKDKKELEKLKIQESQIRENIREIDIKLRQSSSERVKRLQEERDKLDVENKKFQEKLKQVKEESIVHLVDRSPYIYAQDAIMFTSKLIDEKYKKGDLPPKIREVYIKELLQAGECICGTDISKDGPHRARVEKLLKIAQFSKIDQEISKGKFIMDSILKEMKQFVSVRDDYGIEIKSVEDEIVRCQQSLKEISTLIGVDKESEVRRLEDDRKRLEENLSQLIGDIRITQDYIKNREDWIKELQSDYEKEVKKIEKMNYVNKQLNLLNRAIKVIQTIKEELIDEVRKIIETKTKEYFLSLIWKKETFVDIKIDQNYNISVIHKGGWDALPVLAAGEREVLALSFMAALREAARVDYPVVIDTPLGRISREPKENIAELLPKYLNGTQVTLFVTDQEYTSPVRQKLLPWVGKEYKLVFDEKNDETTVVPYESR